MNTLFVGDLHAKKDNLEDTGEIFSLVDETIDSDESIDCVCFLGDIFNTHDVLRLEIAFYVRRQFETIIEKYKSKNRKISFVSLVGNHDNTSPVVTTPNNAVRLTLGDLISVFDVPTEFGPYTMIPFMGDNEEFVRICNDANHNSIPVCHQTFDSAKYENQHTAPNGVKQDLIPQKFIISGHIHMTQILENEHNTVFYPGTPRALNANEVNQCKYIWKFNPETQTRVAITTDDRVKKFIGFTYYQGAIDIVAAKEGEPYPWKKKDDVRIYVEGNEEFYEKVLAANKHLEGEVRFIPNIRKEMSKTLDVEGDGSSVETALRQYVYDVYDMSDDMRDAVWQRLQTWMPKLGTRT